MKTRICVPWYIAAYTAVIANTAGYENIRNLNAYNIVQLFATNETPTFIQYIYIIIINYKINKTHDYTYLHYISILL